MVSIPRLRSILPRTSTAEEAVWVDRASAVPRSVARVVLPQEEFKSPLNRNSYVYVCLRGVV